MFRSLLTKMGLPAAALSALFWSAGSGLAQHSGHGGGHSGGHSSGGHSSGHVSGGHAGTYHGGSAVRGFSGAAVAPRAAYYGGASRGFSSPAYSGAYGRGIYGSAYAPRYGSGAYGGYRSGYYGGGYGGRYYSRYGYGGYYPWGFGFYPWYYGGFGSLLGYGLLGNGLYGGYGYGGYGSGYYGPANSGFYTPAVPPADAYAAQPPQGGPAVGPTDVVLSTHVPNDAQVWVNGQPTTQTGETREFMSNGLEPGRTYTYTIRARWLENGRPVDETRKLKVQGGELRNVDFFQLPTGP